MPTIKIEKKEVEKKYPELMKDIIQELKKKLENSNKRNNYNIKINEININWTYSYVVRIDNETCTTAEEFVNKKVMGSLCGSFKKLKSNRRIDAPTVIIEQFKKSFKTEANKKRISEERKNNLLLNKKEIQNNPMPKLPAVMNGLELMNILMCQQKATKPMYKTIEQLGQQNPNVILDYIKRSENMKLVIYNPQALDADEWGMHTYDIYGAYKDIKTSEIRILARVHEYGINKCITYNWSNIEPNKVNFWNLTRSVILDKFNKAKEGEEFRGFKNKNNYKLTKKEISELVFRKIFTFTFII